MRLFCFRRPCLAMAFACSLIASATAQVDYGGLGVLGPRMASGQSSSSNAPLASLAYSDSYALFVRADGSVYGGGVDPNHYHYLNQVLAPPPGLGWVKQVAAGESFAVALRKDGTVAAWGSNDEGQATVPASLSGVVQVAAGGSHALALKSDGTVVAWGSNSHGESTIPLGLSGVTQVSTVGPYLSVARKANGTVVAWGTNWYGETTVPATLTTAIQVAAGRLHVAALTSAGTVVAWGDNTFGQTAVPAGLTGVVQVGAGYTHTVALKSDGTVVAWGDNSYGQTNVPAGLAGVTKLVVGPYTTCAILQTGELVTWGQPWGANSAVLPPTSAKSLVSVSANGSHALGLNLDGTVLAWGENSQGQSTVPTGLTSVTQVSAGVHHSLALKTDGSVVAWGSNGHGETTVPAGTYTKVSAGYDFSVGLKTGGTVAAWGDNTYGQSTPPTGLSGVIAISAGETHAVAVLSNGTVTCWGSNSSGQCTPPTGLSGVIQAAAGLDHTVALLGGGTVVCWGGNESGQCSVPAGLTGVVKVFAGTWGSAALKSDGTVVTWGYYDYEALLDSTPLVGNADFSIGLDDFDNTLPTLQAASLKAVNVSTDTYRISRSGSANATVFLPKAPEVDTAIVLSSPTSTLVVPSTVTVLAHQNTATFKVYVVPGAPAGPTSLQAEYQSKGATSLATLMIPMRNTPVLTGSLDATQPTGPNSLQKVNLTWTMAGTDHTGFLIQRVVGTTAASAFDASPTTFTVTDPNARSFVDTTVGGNRYYGYRIIALSSDNPSDPSKAVGVTTAQIPSVPTQLKATASSSGITVTFVDPSPRTGSTVVTGFLLQRSLDSGFGSGLKSFTLPASHATGETQTYIDSTVAADTLYYYRVLAISGPLATDWSATASAITGTPKAPVIGTVTYDSSAPVVATRNPAVTITWTPGGSNQTGFVVERSTGSSAGPYSTTFTVANPSATSYQDTTALPNVYYVYRVHATSALGDSAPSKALGIVVPARPAAPSGLAGSSDTTLTNGPTPVTLTFKDNATNETGFVIERATDLAFTSGTTFLTAPSSASSGGTVTFVDSSAPYGSTLYYRVMAVNGPTSSAWSTVIVVKTAGAPRAPYGLVLVTGTRKRDQIRIYWNPAGTNLQGETIEVSTDGVTFSTAKTITDGTFITWMTGLTPNTTYWFRVQNYNAYGVSGYSNVVSGSTLP